MAVIEGLKKTNYVHMLRLDAQTPKTAGTISHTTQNWITGYVDRVVIVPAASSGYKSGFSITLTDNDNVDILNGGGASCSATLTTALYPDYALNSDLDLVIGAAGTNRSGYVKIFWREGENA